MDHATNISLFGEYAAHVLITYGVSLTIVVALAATRLRRLGRARTQRPQPPGAVNGSPLDVNRGKVEAD